jgi:hypothetical protein
MATAVGSQHLYFWPLSLRIAKVSGQRFLYETLIPGFAPALGGLCVWSTLQQVIAPSTWTSLFLCGAVGALVYVAILAGFCLSRSERHDLRLVLAKLGFRKSTQNIK